MQHQKDLNSEIAELFLSIKEYIKSCIGGKVKEKYSKNITSLYSSHGGICYLKTQDGMVRIGWFRRTSRGVVSRILKNFEREGIVTLGRGSILLIS